MKTVTYFVTQRCNKSCEYCDIPTIKRPKDIDIDLFLKYINIINEHPGIEYITLTGGELGLLSRKKLEVIFNNIPFPINVNTNGEFIKRGYIDRWKNKIRLLDYHITGDEIDFYPDEYVHTRYVLVEHFRNKEHIDKMVLKYPHVKFDIRQYENKRPDKKLSKTVPVPKHPNFCHVAIREIDWVKGNLLDCCVSYTQSPRTQLNEETLKKFMTTTASRPFICCQTCIRPYKFFDENLRLWMKNRSK